MTQRELRLAAENAEMRGDIRAIGVAVTALLERLGVTEKQFDDENKAKANIPRVAKNLTIMAMGDGLNSPEVTGLIAVYPVIKKYGALVKSELKDLPAVELKELPAVELKKLP